MFTSTSSSKALYDTVGAAVLGGGGGSAAICFAPRLRLASCFSLRLGAAAVEVAGLAGFAAFTAGAGTGGLLGTTWVPARLRFWPMWVAATISATAASIEVAGGGRCGAGAGTGAGADEAGGEGAAEGVVGG